MEKKFVKGVILTVAMSFVMLGTANAAQCPAATIIRAAVKQTAPSAAASQYFVRVTCADIFTGERGYYLADELGESGYATILTAMSLDQTVLINLEGLTWGSIVTEVQMNAPTN